MDIRSWLRSLGLEKYEAAFRENEIDERVLPNLTQEDLKEIGVGPVGHRRTLLDAIAALRADTGGEAPLFDGATASSELGVHHEDRAERRQVTVMFCDLVGSTALSTRMDPEDLREVISAYQHCAAQTVRRFGGYVARYMGDGLLVYFGYPQAHEDDAERAVRAGLNLIAAVGALNTSVPLQTRVGIATGIVVVGDLLGSGQAQERAIVGETPNLAARLQSIAEPNSVVMGESTRRLVGNLFELQDLGPQDLKGVSGSVRASVALRPASVESRFDALHAAGLTQLVGREEELELLMRRWSKAKAGEGQVILLSGEPGIGKSRLTAALSECLAGEPHTRLRYFCSQQHTDSALYPIVSQMERAAGFAHDDAAQAKLDKLETLLSQSFTPRQDAALFGEMLSLTNDGRYPRLELPPQQRRQKTLEALTAQLETLSSIKPVLMIFEDAHWTDPTSMEALGRAVDRIRTIRLLLIVTYRPEFEPPWIGQPHVTALTLNRLGEREIAAMIDGLTGNKLLPVSIRQDIIERTDGIPLFAEEITKAALEAETEGAAERAIASVPSPSLAVPASLHASLMARLDRLGPAKEVAQIGAAIGREFSHALISAVARKPEAELGSALNRLLQAGLVFRQGQPPHATYLFKHALVQDAAYGTLLREPRRSLHARIAETLESEFPEVAENQPELLARHSSEAGLIEKAAGLWGKAGHRSVARSALVEAIEQLTRALDLIAALPATKAKRNDQIKLQVALLTPIMHVKGYASPEARAAAEKARLLMEQQEALGEQPEDPLLLFSILYGFWVANYMGFKADAMRELSAQFLSFAQQQKAGAAVAVGHRLIGVSLMLTGGIVESPAHFDQALALYDPAQHHSLETRFGQDFRVATLAYRSWTLWLLGYPQAALLDAEAGLKNAREIGQAAGLMYALLHTAIFRLFNGSWAAGKVEADELVKLATSKGCFSGKRRGVLVQGCFAVLTENVLEGVDVITSGMPALRQTGASAFSPVYFSYLAQGDAEIGRYDEADRLIEDVLRDVEATNKTVGG